jgi:hypothetical protein
MNAGFITPMLLLKTAGHASDQWRVNRNGCFTLPSGPGPS